MTTPILVAPSQIEALLQAQWQQSEHSDHLRAALFNLLVFVPNASEESALAPLVAPLLQRFPCRALLIIQDSSYSVPTTEIALDLMGNTTHRACSERIYIRFSPQYGEQVPFLITSHLLPDLPLYVLWKGAPSFQEPLLAPLQPYLTSMIVIPSTLETLPHYCNTVLGLLNQPARRVSDLQWAASLPWRHAFAAIFDLSERFDHLLHLNRLILVYAVPDELNVDLCISSFYLQAWLALNLRWHPVKWEKSSIRYQGSEGEIQVELVDQSSDLPPGTLISLCGRCQDGYSFQLAAHPSGEYVTFEGESAQICEIPSSFHLPRLSSEQILAKEFFHTSTSEHYRKTLELIAQFLPKGAR